MAFSDETAALIAAREKTHGDFERVAGLSTELRGVFDRYQVSQQLTAVQDKALDMIFNKIARIASGNPDFKDHWDDIAGYARLVSDRL